MRTPEIVLTVRPVHRSGGHPISDVARVKRRSSTSRASLGGATGDGGLALVCALHPTPYTLHPTPYTLHPTPYTPHREIPLCPAPCTLYPSPCTLHPTPCTLHPTSYTANFSSCPAPCTLYPGLDALAHILNTKYYALCTQHYALNTQR